MIRVYSVYDDASELYSQPIFCGSGKDKEIDDRVALRIFVTQLLNEGSLLSMYPQDYSLYELGLFDEFNGKFLENDHPRYVFNGLDYLKYWNEYEKPVEDDEIINNEPSNLVKEV